MIVLGENIRGEGLDPHTAMLPDDRRSRRDSRSPVSDQYIEDKYVADIVDGVMGRIGDVLSDIESALS